MTLKRYKIASVLNIIGLTLAFVAFYVIASQVWYSATYNRPLKDSDRVYMVSALWGRNMETDNEEWSSHSPSPVTFESIEAFPQAEVGTHFREFAQPYRVWGKRGQGDFQKYNIGSYDMSPEGLEVFGFDIIAGDATKIKEPNTVVISESAAQRIGVGVGEHIYFEGGEWNSNMRPELPQTVVAIFKDFPKNSFLYDHLIFRNDNRKDGNGNNNWNYSHFIKFEKGADIEVYKKIWMDKYAQWLLGMVEEWKAEYPDEEVYEEGDEILPIRLIPLDKMYFEGNLNSENYEAGTVGSTVTLSAIALAIVIIAFINFVNFFMAMVPARMRSVNICKVFGAEQGTLRRSFLFEAVGLVILAFALALGIIQALQGSFITEYVTCSLSLPDNFSVIAIIFILMIILAVVAAFYPAMHITGFNASLGVKGGYGNSLSGRRIRRILAGVQFAVAMALIIVAVSFWMQYRYQVNYDIGLNRENIVTFSSFDLANKGDAVVEKLQQYPQAVDVTASSSSIIRQYSRWGRQYNGKDFMLNVWSVRWNLPQFFGIEMAGGEQFTEQSHQRREMILTSNLKSEIEIPLGHEINNYTTIGFVKNVKLAPSTEGVKYAGLYCSKKLQFGAYYVRLQPDSDVSAFTKYVKDLVQEFAPGADEPEIMFFNQAIGNLYSTTKRSTVVIALFALLAIIIALMGVFGIVMFETQHRRSEIAIRKVYGADRGLLINMLNNNYVKLVLAGFLVAAPVAWIIVSRWLEQFANRITVPWWVFIVSLMAVLALTVALVSLRSWKAASENPAEVVRGL
ncbi:MAG: ABC transporter permease [Bacteroidales bacterium]|nr:ABC transporter permease [Bacteroidales bacterium]